MHTQARAQAHSQAHAWRNPLTLGCREGPAAFLLLHLPSVPGGLNTALSLRKATRSLWWFKCRDLAEFVSIRTLDTDPQVAPGDLAAGAGSCEV